MGRAVVERADSPATRGQAQWWGISYCSRSETCRNPRTRIGRGARMMMLGRVIRTAADSGAVFLTMEEAVGEFQQRAGRPARART